jgi:hypothetical protein
MKTYKYLLVIISVIVLVGCTSVQGTHYGVVHTANGDYVDSVQSQTAPPSLFQLIFGNMFNYAFSPQGYYFYGNYYPPTCYDYRYVPVGMPPAPYYRYNNCYYVR